MKHILREHIIYINMNIIVHYVQIARVQTHVFESPNDEIIQVIYINLYALTLVTLLENSNRNGTFFFIIYVHPHGATYIISCVVLVIVVGHMSRHHLNETSITSIARDTFLCALVYFIND